MRERILKDDVIKILLTFNEQHLLVVNITSNKKFNIDLSKHSLFSNMASLNLGVADKKEKNTTALKNG